jgi:hypothetical protein
MCIDSEMSGGKHHILIVGVQRLAQCLVSQPGGLAVAQWTINIRDLCAQPSKPALAQ